MTRRIIFSSFVFLSLLLTAGAVFAGAKMLFCLPGFPGTTAAAQPYIDKMLRYLEPKLSWPANSASGLFLPDGEEGSRELLRQKPNVALLGPSIYAAYHKDLKMKVIAKLEVNGLGEQTYSVVTSKAAGPSNLGGLVEKTVAGSVVHDEKYVYNVILDAKIPFGKLILKGDKPLRALKSVIKGEAAAAIVDNEVIAHLKDLPFAGELQIIYTSKSVPAPAVVVIGGNKDNAERLKAVLVGLCSRPDGVELCKSLTITSINAATDSDYKPLLKSYNR